MSGSGWGRYVVAIFPAWNENSFAKVERGKLCPSGKYDVDPNLQSDIRMISQVCELISYVLNYANLDCILCYLQLNEA